MGLRSFSFVAFSIAALGWAGCGNAEPAKTPEVTQVKPPELEEPTTDDSGALDVTCSPPAKVTIDGKDMGESPITNHKVQPGRHEVTCNDEETGPRTQIIDVAASESRNVSSNRIPKIQEQARPEKPDAKKKP